MTVSDTGALRNHEAAWERVAKKTLRRRRCASICLARRQKRQTHINHIGVKVRVIFPVSDDAAANEKVNNWFSNKRHTHVILRPGGWAAALGVLLHHRFVLTYVKGRSVSADTCCTVNRRNATCTSTFRRKLPINEWQEIFWRLITFNGDPDAELSALVPFSSLFGQQTVSFVYWWAEHGPVNLLCLAPSRRTTSTTCRFFL